ncbi:MAG: UvrD-helicase domain-containing protein, partial [Neisseriaceae bacterium]|nr:UvrD-helicase domain-containing protein [Neisseriaceae bacterium]
LLIREGVISHDELIMLAHEMFKNYPKLCVILKNTYPFILVDEYQDTDKQVIEILLDFLPKQTHVPCVVGLFGDAMQSIYDSGVGDVKNYVTGAQLVEVQKVQNRRNPRLVYELANQLRTDGIVQEASTDAKAPNMSNGIIKEGAIRFFYSTGEQQLEALKIQLGWDFNDSKEVKILNLTHNLIADKAVFPKLMAIYDKDKILDYKKRISDFIVKIKQRDINDFSQQTFGEVIECLEKTYPSDVKKIKPTTAQEQFIQANQELYKWAKSLNFEQFRKTYLDKNMLIDDGTKSQNKQDDLIKHLHKLQHNIWLYETGDYNEFLHKTEYKITRLSDKEKLKNSIDALSHMANKTIGESIDFAHEQGICLKDGRLNDFIKKYPYVYERVKAVPYQEFRNLYDYVSGFTPYSTQHKVKGAEFNKVLVILDNGEWNKYNFQNLFESCGTESVLKRTQKLFYVCCTRAKEELVVYFHKPTDKVLEKAKDWFGELFTVN